ncbi:MAG: hypothetical protein KG075_06405 [Alphaproteobacteria bacterium]|nr:hypothetical protein [Alphaproteobacteria bacterium]
MDDITMVWMLWGFLATGFAGGILYANIAYYRTPKEGRESEEDRVWWQAFTP